MCKECEQQCGFVLLFCIMKRLVLHKNIYDKIDTIKPEDLSFRFRFKDCYAVLGTVLKTQLRYGKDTASGMVDISSRRLQKSCNNYREYIELMTNLGVINVSRHFKPGEYCRKYSIPIPNDESLNDDRERFVQVELTAEKNLKTSFTKKKNIHGINFLRIHLEGIEINERMAYDISEEMFQKDLKAPRFRSKKGKYKSEPKRVSPIEALNKRKQDIVNILCKNFYMNRDETAGRVHSNLTTLTSNLFPALTCKGKKLVGYDIANSQPFLFTALVSLFQLENDSTRGAILKYSSISHKNLYKYLQSYLSPINKTHNTPTPTLIPYNTIILREKLSNIDHIKLSEFQNLCLDGTLYSVISKSVFNKDYKNDPRSVKDLFFTLLFTKPGNNKNGIPKFKALYPEVHAVISEFKRLSKKDNFFPVLLQSLESYYIIEVVCKRINAEHPKIPIFTKHDSIYTTEGNEHIVEQIMEEEALNLFGCVPLLRLS